MSIAYGARINDDTNFKTEIDLDNETCETTGYINGEAVDFSGGGSSDLSTAVVTIDGDNIDACLPFCMDQGGMAAIFTPRKQYFPGTYEIALFKGASLIEIYNQATPATSGSIEDFGEGMYLINGDCTITLHI